MVVDFGVNVLRIKDCQCDSSLVLYPTPRPRASIIYTLAGIVSGWEVISGSVACVKQII